MKKLILSLTFLAGLGFSSNAQNIAFECDPVNNSYIEILTPLGSNLRLQTDYTIEFWMFVPSAATSTIHVLNTNFNNQSSTFVRILPNDGATRIELWVNGNSGYNSFPSTVNCFTKGIWNHFALTYMESTGEVSIYINGINNTTGNFPVPIDVNNQTAKICIAANADNSTVTQSAQIDDIRIWSGAKSSQEISDNFNSCLTGQEANLLAYYDFESETGSTVTDKTINGNNGSIININAGFNNYETSGLDCDALSIDKKDEAIMKILPNPTSSNLTIETEEVIETVSIFNIRGFLVQQETTKSFSVEALPAGIYIVNLATENGVQTLIFVKE